MGGYQELGRAGENWPFLLDSAMNVHFTDKQRDVIRLILSGYSNQDVATKLGCSEGAVKLRIERINATLGIKSFRREAPKYMDCELFQIGLRELGILE